MNSTNLTKLSSAILVGLALTACGGGSSNNEQTSNIAKTQSQSEKIECSNGLPKNLKTTGQGFFSDEIYSLETQPNDSGDDDVIVLYSNKLTNGVIYQNLTALLNNQPKKINIEFLESYLLTKSKLDTSFKQTNLNIGFPLAYLISQDDNSAIFNSFTDKCTIHIENQIKLNLKHIDISGMTIADLFKYYDYPNAGNVERYVNSDLAHIIINNHKGSLEKLLANQTKFPSGSKLSYVEQSIFNTPTITFNDSDLTDYKSLEEFTDNTELPSGYIWHKDQFAGYKVVYPINPTTGISKSFVDNYTGVEMNGKIYQAYQVISGDLIKDQMAPLEDKLDMSETYFNKTAVQTLADALNQAL